ncbi:hypothetical protein [Mesorhizobium cantuariense]|uniref:Transposase n=1 Tax=Mesorhizobium cantuariense TaxID=1300275 RepID=A0ABV7MTG3_9HYPH
MPHSRILGFRQVERIVTKTVFHLLEETGRVRSGACSDRLIPNAGHPYGWSEASGASWAGFLKRVETMLRSERPDFRVKIIATDGHKTWKYPLGVSIHLITAKVLSGSPARGPDGYDSRRSNGSSRIH